MYRLQSVKRHFAQERWSLLRGDFTSDSDLGFLEYKVKLAKNLGSGAKDVNFGMNYIFSNGVLFGYDGADSGLQTVYYIEPSEVVYMLRDGDVLYGSKTLVGTRLLWNCL